MNKRRLGAKGEKIARKYLVKQGYEIIEENFWSRYGEIDLIARENDYLVFVEVKLAGEGSSFIPEEQINYYKQKHLQQVAKYYLFNQMSIGNCRFDIVAIYGKQEDHEINLIKNAFLVNE